MLPQTDQNHHVTKWREKRVFSAYFPAVPVQKARFFNKKSTPPNGVFSKNKFEVRREMTYLGCVYDAFSFSASQPEDLRKLCTVSRLSMNNARKWAPRALFSLKEGLHNLFTNSAGAEHPFAFLKK